MKNYVVVLMLLYSNFAWSGWGGVYLNNTQAGMAVEISEVGEYALYLYRNCSVRLLESVYKGVYMWNRG